MTEIDSTRLKHTLTNLQYPFRSSLRTSETQATDSPCSSPHLKYRWLTCVLFLPLLNSTLLADSSSIYDLCPFFECCVFRHAFSSIQLSPLPPRLVALRLIFPRPPASFGATTPNAQIYIWLSSAWHYFAWGFCCFRNGGTWIFPALPGYHKHTTYARVQFPSPNLQRLRPCDGSCLCVT